jgi:hypothetical protein
MAGHKPVPAGPTSLELLQAALLVKVETYDDS